VRASLACDNARLHTTFVASPAASIHVSPYELAIGLRYTRARKGSGRNTFISFIAIVSAVGIWLGVWALIVVLSVMNGFQQELRNRILAVASHVEIQGFPALRDAGAVERKARENPHVVATAPYVTGQAMLSVGDANRGVLIRGVDPRQESKVEDIADHMRRGSLDSLAPGSFNIVLGVDLARALGVRVGDSVVAITPQGVVTPAGALPRIKSFTVSGIFDAGMAEFDSGLAFVNIDDAERLYRLEGPSGVRLKLDDLFAAPIVSRELAGTLREDAAVTDWTRTHANFFRAVAIEKRMMFLILALIIAVAAFNIVSAQVMTVTDKRADIAILRTLGASPSSIMGIFTIQGALVGIMGTVAGVITGIVLALNIDVVVPAIERTFGIHFLDKSVYYISELPSQLQTGDVVSVAAMALVLALLATLYPSWTAARVNPAEALRYE
jgi:lipoprotein-releasing system permease protein